MADLAAAYDAEGEQGLLAAVLFPRYQRMLTVMHRLVESAYPELNQAGYVLDDAAVRRQLALAAERVVLIDGATQRALQETLDGAETQGTGLVAAAAAFYAGAAARAKVIARTELAEAQRAAALDRYRATGLVSRVQIVERRDTDEPCAARNGQVVPVHANPQLLHPSCMMRLVPVVDEVAA